MYDNVEFAVVGSRERDIFPDHTFGGAKDAQADKLSLAFWSVGDTPNRPVCVSRKQSVGNLLLKVPGEASIPGKCPEH